MLSKKDSNPLHLFDFDGYWIDSEEIARRHQDGIFGALFGIQVIYDTRQHHSTFYVLQRTKKKLSIKIGDDTYRYTIMYFTIKRILKKVSKCEHIVNFSSQSYDYRSTTLVNHRLLEAVQNKNQANDNPFLFVILTCKTTVNTNLFFFISKIQNQHIKSRS